MATVFATTRNVPSAANGSDGSTAPWCVVDFIRCRCKPCGQGSGSALPEDAPLVEMKILLRDGEIYGGADALVEIARAIWWLWPLFIFAQIPGAKALLRKTYL